MTFDKLDVNPNDKISLTESTVQKETRLVCFRKTKITANVKCLLLNQNRQKLDQHTIQCKDVCMDLSQMMCLTNDPF